MLQKLKNIKVSKITIYLTLSDIFAWSGFLISGAMVGIYLEDRMDGDTLKYLGVGIGIYYFVRAILQLPIGLIADKVRKDRDEILLSFTGIFLMGASYLFYPVIKTEYHYYILQFVFATGAAMYLICWRTLFAKNLNKNNEGLEYGVYETFFGIAVAVLSVIAGSVANLSSKYFDLVLWGLGLLTILGNIWIVLIYWTRNRKSEKE